MEATQPLGRAQLDERNVACMDCQLRGYVRQGALLLLIEQSSNALLQVKPRRDTVALKVAATA